MAYSDVINGKQTDWLTVTQHAFSDGRMYFDAGIRREIEQDVRQFQGLHPLNSKYLSDAYRTRAKFFRPKTRSAIRKNEAIAAAALFSNSDIVELTPWDDSDKTQRASASLHKELLSLRLKRNIPWFQISIGAYQEAQSVGVVAAHVYWKVDKKKQIDQPMVELIPVENLVLSPAASWYDPINTSPYVVHLIPMYVKDVMARMKPGSAGKTNSRWNTVPEATVLTAVRHYSDSIRLARETGRPDSQAQATSLNPYQLVWVYRTIADIDGEDYVWYSLEDLALLSSGAPLKNVFWHGIRPYVLGNAIVEPHRLYPSSVSRLTRDTQGELNENANLRIDNVRAAMAKRFFVRRGSLVDPRSLTRFVAGGITLVSDVEKDVKPEEFKDVTRSAYEEQDRLNNDFDELAGSFSQSSVQGNRTISDKLGGMELLSEDANQIQGYQLRTYVETFVEPLLYHIVRLEMAYETDQAILALCGKKANLASDHGVSVIDDNLLMQDLALTVHVGIGATSPRKQLENLLWALTKIKEILEGNVLQMVGLDIEEVCSEIFGKIGYKSADRFFEWDTDDPRIIALKNQVQQLQDAVANKKDPPEIIAAKVALLQAQVKKTLSDAFNVNVEGLFGAMQAAEVVAAVPAVAPVADTIAKAAGYEQPQPPGISPSIENQSAGQPQGAPAPQVGEGQVATPAAAPAAGLSVEAVKNHRTGVDFTPGSGVAPQLPPGVPHNTHPNFPAKPASAVAGENRGIEGGR